MNRADFVKEIAKRKGISRQRAYCSVNAVIDTLRQLLANGESIEIGGFGTFEMLTDMRGEHIPVFKSGKALNRVLNTSVQMNGEGECGYDAHTKR